MQGKDYMTVKFQLAAAVPKKDIALSATRIRKHEYNFLLRTLDLSFFITGSIYLKKEVNKTCWLITYSQLHFHVLQTTVGSFEYFLPVP